MDNLEKEQQENDDVLLYVLARKDELMDEDEVAPTGSEMDSAKDTAEKAEKQAVEAARSKVSQGPELLQKLLQMLCMQWRRRLRKEERRRGQSAGAAEVEEEEELESEEEQEEAIVREEMEEEDEEEVVEEEVVEDATAAATGAGEEEVLEEEAATGAEEEEIVQDVGDVVGCLKDLLSGSACGGEERGVCGDDGHCTCREGFEGENCELVKCVDECNQRGTCDTNTGVCTLMLLF